MDEIGRSEDADDAAIFVSPGKPKKRRANELDSTAVRANGFATSPVFAAATST